MTAQGKITAKEIGSRPLGSVRILLTDDRLGGPATPGHAGPWLPAKNKRGMVAATVTNVEYVSGSRRHKVYLTTDRGSVVGVMPNQTFWIAPADNPEPTAAPDDRPTHTTPKLLQDTRGVRVLITGRHEDGAGGGAGEWCAAKKVPPRYGVLSAKGEPAGIHAVTVIEVRPSATPRRFDVVTNLGTVEGVTAGQRFRLAPDDVKDTADIRASIRADQERTEAAKELNRTNPRDVDGVRVAPGELVELLSVNDEPGGTCHPYRVTRAIRAYGDNGAWLLVASAYERAYSLAPAGTTLAMTFRRLADQTDGPTAVRSCGCPATVRDAIVPPPADGDTDAWAASIEDRDRMAAEDRTHREGCRWYVPAEPVDVRPAPVRTLGTVRREWQSRYGMPAATFAAYVERHRVAQVYTFDPTAVHIERHRASVTQGEASVSYRGELLGRFGDDVQSCTDGPNCRPGCFGGFHGRTDRHWIDAAASTVGRLGADLAAVLPVVCTDVDHERALCPNARTDVNCPQSGERSECARLDHGTFACRSRVHPWCPQFEAPAEPAAQLAPPPWSVRYRTPDGRSAYIVHAGPADGPRRPIVGDGGTVRVSYLTPEGHQRGDYGYEHPDTLTPVTAAPFVSRWATITTTGK